MTKVRTIPAIGKTTVSESCRIRENTPAFQEQHLSRGEMIFSQKGANAGFLPCSLGEVAGCRGRVAPCKTYAYRRSSEAGFAVK